jgi:hypothetical protein
MLPSGDTSFVNCNPWCQQYTFNTSTYSALGAFTALGTLPYGAATTNGITFILKSYAYFIYQVGGTCWRAPIDSSGVIGTWTQLVDKTIPVTTIDASAYAFTTRSMVYIVMGTDLLSATYNSDGSLNTWVLTTGLFAAGNGKFPLVYNGRIYLVGGTGGVSYVAPIDSSGIVGTFKQLANSAPVCNRGDAFIIAKNIIHRVCGGNTGNLLNIQSTIDSNGNIGPWTTSSTQKTYAVGRAKVIATRNRVYVFSGHNGGYTTYTQSAPINSDGTIGTWIVETPTVSCTDAPELLITSSRLYAIGGAYSKLWQYAPFSGGLNDYSGVL